MEKLQLEKMNNRRDERIEFLEKEKNEANQSVRLLSEEVIFLFKKYEE